MEKIELDPLKTFSGMVQDIKELLGCIDIQAKLIAEDVINTFAGNSSPGGNSLSVESIAAVDRQSRPDYVRSALQNHKHIQLNSFEDGDGDAFNITISYTVSRVVKNV